MEAHERCLRCRSPFAWPRGPKRLRLCGRCWDFLKPFGRTWKHLMKDGA